MAQYIIGPAQCTGWDPSHTYHPFSGRVVLDETVDELNNQSIIAWKFQIYINRNDYISGYTSSQQNQVWITISDENPAVNPSTKKYVNISSGNIGSIAMANHYISDPVTLSSGTITVKHNNDGAKSLYVYAKFNQPRSFDTVLKTIELSGTQSLQEIPRSAVISSAPAITLPVTGTVDHTVAWESQVSTFWYKLEYKYGSTSLHISDATQATSLTYAVPASISEYVTNAKTMQLSAVLHTYQDQACTNEVGTNTATVTVTFSDDYAPDLSYTLDVDNSAIPSAYRSTFTGLAIQYTSKLALAFTGTPVHNATISGFTCVADGKGYSGASVLTDPIQGSGDVSITAVVTDSRGFSTSISITREVIPYSYPQIKPYGTYAEIQVFRCDSLGMEDDRGQQVKMMASSQSCEILSGAVNLNRAVIKYQYLSGSTWSGYTTISDTGDASINDIISGIFPETNAFTFEIHAEDLLGNSSGVVMINVPISDIPLHLREGGHGVGIGEYASVDPDKFMVGYESHFSKPIYTDVGMAISAVDSGSSTMADLWDAVKESAGGTGAVTLTAAYGNMGADDYTYICIPYDDENGLFYFSLLGSDTGDLWIVHIINDTICQPFKLTGTR